MCAIVLSIIQLCFAGRQASQRTRRASCTSMKHPSHSDGNSKHAPPPPPPSSLEDLFRSWGLDASLSRYHCRSLGIENLYPWQARCLAEPGVMEGSRDLLYFAPTSGGKTMVAELLLLLRVAGPLARSAGVGGMMGDAPGKPPIVRRAMVVLPFISMVTEKVKHLRRVVAPYNRGRPKQQRIKIVALYGNKGGGGLRGAQIIAVCTIEKANALVNRMAAADELHELSCLVLDELHMIGDGSRGQTLELLLTKVLRANRVTAAAGGPTTEARTGRKPAPEKDRGSTPGTVLTVPHITSPPSIPPFDAASAASQGSQSTEVCLTQEPVPARCRTQVTGMSATLSNAHELAGWLGAALHVSDFRPVPLDERVMLGMEVYDRVNNVVRTFAERAHPETDPDHVVTLCRESCRASDQIIIFCSTKAFCQNCAIKVANNLKVEPSKSIAAKRLALVAQLAKEMSMGVDPILQETIPHGVAFHHAGLADTERSAIEKAFREGTLSVLAATSTLGAGVNLPAGRVILRNLNAAGGGLSATSYRQMSGRAGRKGAGRARGESVIVAGNKGQMERARALMNAGLAAVKSALAPANDGGAGITRLVLEGICGKLLKSEAELADYVACTLLWCQQPDQASRQLLLDHAWAALQLLRDEECIQVKRPPPRSAPRLNASRQQHTRPRAAAPATTTTTTGAAVSPATVVSSFFTTKAIPNPYRPRMVPTVPTKTAASPAAVAPAPACRATAAAAGGASIQKIRQSAASEPLSRTTAVGSTGSNAEGVTDAHCGTATGAASHPHARGTDSARIGGGLAAGGGQLLPTKLGLAIFRSSMAPGDGLAVFRDLSEAAKGVNLRNTLHLAYLLTPLCPPSGLRPNWEWLRSVYSKAATSTAESPPGPGADILEVFHRIGVTEGMLHAWANRGPRGGGGSLLISPEAAEMAGAARRLDGEMAMGARDRSIAMHNRREAKPPPRVNAVRNAVRLVAAMALTDISDGASLGQVARAYGMSKGDLQSLRQSAATFSGMVASFLKELGWTLFLMVVKGHIPKLSLGVSSHLLPLMQVPGMSRSEASALFQGGIVNAKSLLAASPIKVATDLRINVPFRTRTGGGKERGTNECIRFERRAQTLTESAREVIAKREKGSKAQTAKLLKVVQGRLGIGAGSLTDATIGGALGHEFIRPAAKRTSSSSSARKKREFPRGGGSNHIGVTGLSDDDGSSDGDGASDSGSSSDGETEEDDLDRAVAALEIGGLQEQEDSEDDSDKNSVGNTEPELPRRGGDARKAGGVAGGVGRSSGVEAKAVRSVSGEAVIIRTTQRMSEGVDESIRDSAAGLGDAQKNRGAEDGEVGIPVRRSGKHGPERDPTATASVRGIARGGSSGKRTSAGGTGGVATGYGDGSVIAGGGGSGSLSEISSPAAEAAQHVLMTSADIIGSCAAANGTTDSVGSHSSSSGRNAPYRTPVKEPPTAGSQCFLYEAETPLPEVLSLGSASSSSPSSPDFDTCSAEHGGDGGEAGGIGPAFDACRQQQQQQRRHCGGGCLVSGGGGKEVDVFALGPRAMSDFSKAWRRSRCFAFILGGRVVRPVAAAAAVAGGGRGWGGRGGGLGRAGADASYRRSWERFASTVLPAAPYTVGSAGESFVPASRHECEDEMQVLSGIAVSFDGKTSQYLPLPPLLPPRPAEWYSAPPLAPIDDQKRDCRFPYTNSGVKYSAAVMTTGAEVTVAAGEVCQEKLRDPTTGEGDAAIRSLGIFSWKYLSARAVEMVAVSVGFPWLCAGWSSDAHHNKRPRQDGNSGRRKRFKCWNQTLFVCRRWNALGVDALNRLTGEEPSGRWGLLRDVMEDSKATKVSMDIKSALVCLQGLGIRVRGPLEDPAVASWLAEPPIDDAAIAALAMNPPPHESKKRKASKALRALPKACVTSLTLPRPPGSFVDLWCLQAAATLSLMAEKEWVLRDLSLVLPFHLIEMPAVVAAASMEYCGLGVKAGLLHDMRREVDQRLRDLRGMAEQLVQGTGDVEGEADKTMLASSKRVHDVLYRTLQVKPPPSWQRQFGGSSASSIAMIGGNSPDLPGPRGGGHSKQAKLGPTDTASLEEILALTVPAGPNEDSAAFIRAVIQHRGLVPASHSLGRLLRARRWHVPLGGTRVNPRIELFTSTGRMVTSDPPLQNLEHQIRFARSWRLSLAEEREADVQDLQVVPVVWANDRGVDTGEEGLSRREAGVVGLPALSQGSVDEEAREALKVILANSGSNSATMSTGQIVAVVEDRCLDDPIFRLPSVAAESDAAAAAGVAEDAVAATRSLASYWRERGFTYTEQEAKRTPQVLVRLGSPARGPVYSYPADKVWRVRASFLVDHKALSLLGGDAGAGSPWFGKEVLLKPREAVVASLGYTFISADYSQVEMRLMAHLSGDPDLVKVFTDGGDVFRRISAALRGADTKPEDVTDEERRRAKVLVYGVLYGQSAAALAQQLGVRTGEACKIRETVLTTYPKLRDYIQQVKKDCKINGYVETLLGRRRYLPEINSSDDRERARAERQAANTVCQGSAADLLKLAATNVAARLDRCKWMSRPVTTTASSPTRNDVASCAPDAAAISSAVPADKCPCRFPDDRGRAEVARRPPCRLVLSIHDELLYEVLEPHAAKVAAIVKACMERAVSLSVPLVAHPREGTTWGEMKLCNAAG